MTLPRTHRRVWAAATAVVVVAAAVAGAWLLGGDDEDAAAPTSTTSAPTTTTTGPSSTTTVTTVPVDASTAVWPWAESDLRYDDPEEAARGFAVGLVGFRDPLVGAFRQGDSRSGEVEVRANERGAVTTVFVRQLGPDGHWWVLGSGSPNIVLEQPGAGEIVSSPVRLAGRSRAFEAQVDVAVHQDGRPEPLGRGFVMGSGSADLDDFRGEVDFETPAAPYGAVVLSTTSAEDGRVWEASVVRVRFERWQDGDGGGSATACAAPGPAPPGAGEMAVQVHLTCEHDGIPSTPVARTRVVPRTPARLRVTLEALLAGPTSEEEAAGFTSWFSDATASLLRGVDLDDDGTATVDFDAGLARTIPNASTSAGSAILLSQLDATVFGVGGVHRVEYRLGGSCDAFFEWLQSECDVRTPG